MKKKKLILTALIGVLLLLALPVSNLVIGLPRSSLAAAAPADALFANALTPLAEKCSACHAGDADLPFYANFPVASGLVEADRSQGLRHIDFLEQLRPAEGQPVSEVTLSRIEKVLDNREMPPARFLALHWDGALSDGEETQVLKWIRAARKANYATGTASAAYADEVIQPIPDQVDLELEKVLLGKALFHDSRLSSDNTLSCASCHPLDKGGCDQLKYAKGVGGAVGPINVPTVYNSHLQFKFFWDGRAATLEEQAAGPVNNPIEMGSNWPQVLKKLKTDAETTKAFNALYEDGLTSNNIVDAIAEYERSLFTPNSAFDLYLKGDDSALSEDAKAGYAVFKKRGCATCHVGKAVGGQSYEYMGLKQDYFAQRGDVLEVDNGRFNVTAEEKDRHKFKVPTLRNIDLTPPYFHDGTTADLGQAVQVMARNQLGEEMPANELAKVLAFLTSLTGTYRGEPLK